MVKRNEKTEFLGQLIDVFEDFLDEKGIVIPNPEKDDDPDNPANLYGTDYGNIQSALEEIWRPMCRWQNIFSRFLLTGFHVRVLSQ